jgi:hypothetical protein
MKLLTFALLCSCLNALAQTAPPQMPAPPPLPAIADDAVVAVFEDGVSFTMSDFKTLIAGLPEANRNMALIDRKNFLEWWAGIRKLAKLAEKAGLDQKSPAKEQLLLNRAMILGEAMLTQQANYITVPQEDVAAFYAANRERFKRVRVKAIYIAFGQSAAEGKKPLTEEKAEERAKDLLAKIRAGADFVKLVREYSDDAASRERDGEFGTLSASSTFSDAIRGAVFALNKGEVTEPVRQASGFYLLRAEEVAYGSLAETQAEISMELRQQTYNKWLLDLRKDTRVTFPEPAFVNSAPRVPAAPAQPEPKK